MELESHGQFVIVINFFLVAPGTSMAPDRTDPAIPSGPVIAVERGVLVIGKICFFISPCPGEDIPASPYRVESTRKAAVTDYKPQCLIGVVRGARSRFRRWEGSSNFIGQLPAA